MQFLRQLLDKIPPVFKNFYLIVLVLFVTWTLFFDKNDLITHVKLKSELSGVEAQRDYYVDKIKIVETNQTELEDDRELLEKFAREKYLMKRDEEDLYIIEYETEE